MPRNPNLVMFLRVGAAVVAAGGGIAFAMQTRGAGGFSPAVIALPALLLLLSAGAALSMLGLAVMLARDPNHLPPDAYRALSNVQSQVAELSARVNELRQACERLANAQPFAGTDAPAAPLTPSDLEPIFQGLREVRELTLLTDCERRDRLERLRHERRESLVKQAFDLVAARQWPQAERLVLAMEIEFPSDNEVARGRSYLNHARKLNEDEAVVRTLREVDELMSNSAWDQAHSKAQTLVDGFPENAQARSLLLRVQKEREAFRESTVHRMFDELRNDIDRRMWRRALLHGQHLLEKFPQHPRAEGVRKQLKTLQDNAEIEERQELEVRIQELIRDQRFDDAIELGEDVIRRYPMSPQAESLDTLLPRLRDLARGGVAEFSGLSPEFDEEEPEHRLA